MPSLQNRNAEQLEHQDTNAEQLERRDTNTDQLEHQDTNADRLEHQTLQDLEALIDTLKGSKGYEYLHGRFLTSVRLFDAYNRRDGDQYNRFQWSILIVSALTPFFIGLEAITNWGSIAWKILALFTSVIVAVFGNALKTFNLQARWVDYRATREALVIEFYRFYGGVGVYAELGDDPSGNAPSRMMKFEETIEKMLGDANSRWSVTHQPSPQ
jgi:hypothetical protein